MLKHPSLRTMPERILTVQQEILSGVALVAFAVALLIAISSMAAFAEEAGTGHYIPGATSSFIDMLPDRGSSTFVYANGFTYYEGSAGASNDLEFGGLLTANAKGTVYSDT